MSVWKSDEKLLIFVSLISPSLCWRSNIKHSTKIICASHFQLSSQCFIWWWNTYTSHAWCITSINYHYEYLYANKLILILLIVILHFSRTDFSPDQKLSEGLQDLLRGYDPRISPNYSGITQYIYTWLWDPRWFCSFFTYFFFFIPCEKFIELNKRINILRTI